MSARLKLKEAYQLTLVSAWGQASHLTCTSRRLLGHFRDGDWQASSLHSLFAICQSTSISQNELLYMLYVPQSLRLLPGGCILTAGTGGHGSLCFWSHRTIIIGATKKGAHTPIITPIFVVAARGHLISCASSSQ